MFRLCICMYCVYTRTLSDYNINFYFNLFRLIPADPFVLYLEQEKHQHAHRSQRIQIETVALFTCVYLLRLPFVFFFVFYFFLQLKTKNAFFLCSNQKVTQTLTRADVYSHSIRLYVTLRAITAFIPPQMCIYSTCAQRGTVYICEIKKCVRCRRC